MVLGHQESHQMKIDHGDITIDDNSLSILRLLRDRRDTGPVTDGGTAVHGAKTKEMVETTDLSRGSVHYRVTTKLQSKGLVEVIGTEQGNGAVEDAQIWGLTEKGQEWIDSLNTEDLPPAAASSEAAEIAREARRIANQANAKREEDFENLDKAAAELHPADANSFKEWMDSVGKKVTENRQRLDSNRDRLGKNLEKVVSSNDLAAVQKTADAAATSEDLANTNAQVNALTERLNQLDGGSSGTGQGKVDNVLATMNTISEQIGEPNQDTVPIEKRVPTTERELIELEAAADNAKNAVRLAKVASAVAVVAVVIALVAIMA